MSEPDLFTRVTRRHRALRELRRFFDERGFLEVESSLLVVAPTTEPHIDPLRVPLRPDVERPPEERYLRTSPELAMKRMLSAGLERIYEIGKVFRDGERGPIHLPEFSMLEWYRAQGTLDDLVRDLEELCRELALAFHGRPVLFAPDGREISVEAPFERHSVAALFERCAGVDLPAALDEMAEGDALALVRRVKASGHHLREGADFEDAFFHVMVSVVEPAIDQGRPVVVERWPRQMAVLSRLCADDPRFAGRFELYAGGLELANAFDELTDAVEQRARFIEDNEARVKLGKPALPLDERFLEELPRMPPTAGIALGLDRLLMLLFGAKEIDEVNALRFR